MHDQPHEHGVNSISPQDVPRSSSHGQMYFRADYQQEHVLFMFWSIQSLEVLIGSCVGLFLVAAFLEALKVYRQRFALGDFRFGLFERQKEVSFSSTDSETKGAGSTPTPAATHVCSCRQATTEFRYVVFTWEHALQTFLYMVQLALSYMLMLVFMTFNVWLCAAVILGAGFGYCIFDRNMHRDGSTGGHCH